MESGTDPNETKEAPRAIKGVDKETVHRICSGQVVLDLTTAVKELVENSVDAGATNIEIRLKESGTLLLEVIDNGHGVREIDFQGLTTKHATSKLATFNDLFSVETFGFRGEALSSLCALSEVSISTRHTSSEIGTVLEFDHNGKITSQKKQARSVGTTVIIKELFGTMPVRRREFLRNSRRELNKMIHILQAYCLISNGVRISCSDVTAKGKRVSVLSTNGNGNMRENIIDIFGPKQIQSLEEIRWDLEKRLPEEALEHFNIRFRPDECPGFRVSGFVSSCVHGQGRNSNDRQFYFVNGRPCEPAKLSKIVNEIYHQFNRHQNPFVCLNVETKRQEVDVNITPDKRQVLFENEKFLLATVRSALLEVYEKSPATFELQTPKVFSETQLTPTTKMSEAESPSSHDSEIVENKEKEKPEESPNTSFSLENLRRSFAAGTGSSTSNSCQMTFSKRRKIETTKSCQAESSSLSRYLVRTPVATEELCFKEEPQQKPKITFFEQFSTSSQKTSKTDEDQVASQEVNDSIDIKPKDDIFEAEIRVWEDEIEGQTFDKKSRKTKNVVFSMDILKKHLDDQKREKEKETENVYRKFLAKISPNENETAEQELRKEFHQDDFRRMQIFGQFNLGFIIAGKGDDLFIIDQHATDEKFNFERLQNARDTEILTQRLVIKQSLELTATNEDILIENIEMFRANGFEFEIHRDSTPTQRVFLTQIPHSKNWIFGKQDVEELIFMLSDDSSVPGINVYRPSRVRAMFASRACRSSVMIGTALSKSQMRQLIDHMSEMDNPWSCPHGRPTMRHLVNLNLIQPK